MYNRHIKKYLAFLAFHLLIAMNTLHASIEYDEAVSLGFSCEVSWELENSGKRFFAYPFDWFHTSSDSLTGFIQNKGANFLDPDKISNLGPYPGDSSYLHIIDLVYGIQSYHDFLASPLFGNYPHVRAKYERRIKRFFDLLNSQKRVLFVRQDSSREQIENLDNLLHSSYPNLSYTILAISDNDGFHNDWGLERVKNYYLKKVVDWHGDVESWQKILINFPIASQASARSPEETW